MKSKRGDCNGFQSLEPEIISEILARLPIAWIIICKSVCKTWYAIIYDNYFAKLQLSVANNRPSSPIIFEPLRSMIKDEVNKLYMLDVEDCKVREIPVFPFPDINNRGLKKMCSLDGLICVALPSVLDPVVIYNPLIRGDYIILPKTEVGKVFLPSHHITLGFDPSINKYKAVRMLTYSANSLCYSLCEVITIGEESSWRRVVAPYAGLILHSFGCRGGVFHQGSIYWIIDKFDVYNGEINSSNNREFILEFDVTKEVFAVVSFPHSMKAPKYRSYGNPRKFNMQLQILGESLALMEMEGRLLHIWRLVKQNGTTAVVGYSSIRIDAPYKYATIVALLCPNGTEDLLFLLTDHGYEPGSCRKDERIMTNGSQFYYYYPYSKKNDRFVKLSTLPFKSPYFFPYFYPWCFKPSFISIKASSLSHL